MDMQYRSLQTLNISHEAIITGSFLAGRQLINLHDIEDSFREGPLPTPADNLWTVIDFSPEDGLFTLNCEKTGAFVLRSRAELDREFA